MIEVNNLNKQESKALLKVLLSEAKNQIYLDLDYFHENL